MEVASHWPNNNASAGAGNIRLANRLNKTALQGCLQIDLGGGASNAAPVWNAKKSYFGELKKKSFMESTLSVR